MTNIPMDNSDTAEQPTVSVVIPFYNEGENVSGLMDDLHRAMELSPWPWEAILVDDGSEDGTLARMESARRHFGDHVRIVGLQRNFGQTAATQAGIDAAAGELVVTLDGDRQNDPEDIVPLVRRVIREELDLVVGWRKSRQDGFLLRRLPSLLANRLIGRVTGVRLHDYGCSLKVYRASVLRSVRLYGEMHRFIPAWFAASTSPTRISEEVVNHRPRIAGTSKYGFGRTFRVLLDLLSVHFFMRYWTRPGHFFGSIGLVFGSIGGVILAYLAWVKFWLGEDIGTRPLLLVGIVLVIASLQFITTGVIAELLTRTYFESSNAKPYVVRTEPGSSRAWAKDLSGRRMTHEFPELGPGVAGGPFFSWLSPLAWPSSITWDSAPLFDRDEGAFSEATREMVESGNYVSTTLNGEPRYDKPILTYYVQAVGVAILGWNEAGLRLHSALAAVLWVLVVWGFARREWDDTTGWVAGIITATSLWVMVIGRAATADALLNLFLALTLFDLYRFWKERRRAPLYRVFLWSALGFLTKGPVAVAIPLAAAFLLALVRGQLMSVSEGRFRPHGVGHFPARSRALVLGHLRPGWPGLYRWVLSRPQPEPVRRHHGRAWWSAFLLRSRWSPDSPPPYQPLPEDPGADPAGY